MKKILSLTSSKILLFCGMGLLMTIGGFWHYQTNQVQHERMNVLNQGVATCFNRISQTFTAMMIKDIKSPYLHQAFMSLSDECLNETIKGMNPFKADAGKGYDVLNKLISEVHWFHEKVLKIHAPMLAGKELNPPMSTLSDRFAKMENYKITLLDEVDMTNEQIRQVQTNDEFLMGAGLIMFVLSLSALALKEFSRVQNQIQIEKEAINLLKAGQANVGAMVDRLVERSLTSQGFPVTAQIFKDYHETLLERSNARIISTDEAKDEPEEMEEDTYEVAAPVLGPKASLKEVVVSLQNIHSKELLNISDVRDVSLAIAFESFEQMMNAAVTLFSSHRQDTHKKIMISNQIHSDRTVINLFLANSTFTSAELEANQNDKASMAHIADVNLMIMKEMAAETGTQFTFENKTDRQGKIAGMTLKFVINRAAREQKLKNLISVVKGKKKDLARQLIN
jgi:uncharacterized membrane protein YidH (DUF202 family)